MPEKLPLSVFIISKDEADRIAYTINSVKNIADEIIVIDSGSTDETIKIANNLGAKVIENEWPGFGPQKVFGEKQCKNKWLLNLDCDEALTPELEYEIRDLFNSGKLEDHSSYRMHWKMLFPWEKKPALWATRSTFVRLYNKEKSGFSKSQIHDSVLTNEGSIGELKSPVIHRNYRNVNYWIKKNDHYTTKQAEDWINKGRPSPSIIRMVFEAPVSFLKAYFLRRYFLYGVHGFIFSTLYAFAKFIRLVKVRELYLYRQSDD